MPASHCSVRRSPKLDSKEHSGWGGGRGIGKDGGQGRESGVVRRGWERRTGLRREGERAKQHGCESEHRVSFCTRSPDTAGKGLGDTEVTLNFPPSISLTDCGDGNRI